MNFAYVVRHLSDQRFCTRASWNGHTIVTFGMDNILQAWCDNREDYSPHVLSLADAKADDWVVLPGWWDPRVTLDDAVDGGASVREMLCSNPYKYSPIKQYLEGLLAPYV